MESVRISDITLKQKSSKTLSFRQRLDIARLLDRLHVDVIELPPITNQREDILFIKSIAENLKNAAVCVSVGIQQKEEIKNLHTLLNSAKYGRIQLLCPVSSVQMEYFYHKKSEAMLTIIAEAISFAKSLGGVEVELMMNDATRGETDFIKKAIQVAVGAGVDLITICDDAAVFMPDGLKNFLKLVLPESAVGKCRFGLCVNNNLCMADVCSIVALDCGVSEIKTCCTGNEYANTENIVKILHLKNDELGCKCNVNTSKISKVISVIRQTYAVEKNELTPFEDGVRENKQDRIFTVSDSLSVIAEEIRKLGYDLSEEDMETVYKVFSETATRKGCVSLKELDAIIASSAMQVRPTYTIDYYIINSGNTVSATSHIKMHKDGEVLEGVSVGDGAIDASFLAIERITGKHYELDDFQIQAISEGREAMGETIVKLRAEGKIYSGRGVSTDIIGSSILAYVSALNKIAYEEKESVQ